MKIAGLTETVSVSADRQHGAGARRVVRRHGDRANLPINGRDYRDFALLSPTAQRSPGPAARSGVAGQPGDYLALNVDGADFTNNFFGEFFGSLETQNFTIPLEAVQEFEVSAGGLGAQSGRSNGGLVNVVTKSGSNRAARVGRLLPAPSRADRERRVRQPAVGLVRHDGGGSLGGPIVADRTFYFVAADIQRQTTPLTVKFARTVAGVAVPELGIADLGALEGQYPRHEDVTTVLAKSITCSRRAIA